ncbi:restriction endonuclease subunit S [Tenacibaculum maritimum]|uniref:restriction endonuclease subunit S n=1 Tax=Tenacibaculum maritimum TaxID=107401 RepID=UPI001E30C5E7|nr:restriction endonuclease subunit S [Tenacibaculum maritimum]MCD9563404.1 restriction endonuclease subunit S [Tenacibaculum maritimum]MCD9566972.1 restriction endonuclease subunit S [Tenacibaculum maritimum]MCD9579645.1 restriction endonuclease subunit S [Tenacibaculum maritimum]MCD9597023.1 restriction endonuclease subunit S [Tenacibaculum maritimum]MCD9614091.1 restriction endonuclease subunit S [Tenacibaculum maritimum]
MAYHRYSKYKDCDIPWVKEIPQDWLVTEVRNVFSKNDIKNEKLEENNLLTLSYGSIKRKSINTAGGLLPASFDSYQILTKGMIVLRMLDLQNDKNSLRVGYVPERGIITSAYIGLDSKIECDTKYFYYLLHFMDLIKHFYNRGGGVRQSIGFTDFRREKIIIPSTSEQTSIANFLDYKLEKINRFITKKKQLIELLAEQKAAIINKAVTKGINPNAKLKPSRIEWLGDIPEHWEVTKLSGLCAFVRGSSNFKKDELLSKGKYVALQYGKTYKVDEVDENFEFYINDEFFKESQVVNYGDIIIISTSETIEDLGHSVFYNRTDLGLLGGEQLLLKPNSKIVDGKYLCYSSKVFTKELQKYATGVKVYRFNINDLKTIYTTIPSIREQKEIVSYIDTESKRIDRTISTIEKEITLVKEYKAALISEAVTGKIDVRNFKIPETEKPLAMVAEETINYKSPN